LVLQRQILCILFVFLPQIAVSKNPPKKGIELALPDGMLQGVIEYPAFSAPSKGEVVVALPTRTTEFATHPFRILTPSPTPSIEFGKAVTAKRYSVPSPVISRQIVGILDTSKATHLVDGHTLDIHRFNDWQYIEVSSIAWDFPRPAADSRGEPTKVETARFQAAFKKAMLKAVGTRRIAGAQPLSDDEYIVGTTLPDFPLFTMRCAEKEKLGGCFFDRGCFISGDKKGVATSVSFAFSRKRKLALFLEPANHAIRVYKFHNCYHSSYAGELQIPKRLLKPATAIHIDSEDRLWLTTEMRDNVSNGNSFVWLDWPSP
jgi:hypothetical protein